MKSSFRLLQGSPLIMSLALPMMAYFIIHHYYLQIGLQIALPMIAYFIIHHYYLQIGLQSPEQYS